MTSLFEETLSEFFVPRKQSQLSKVLLYCLQSALLVYLASLAGNYDVFLEGASGENPSARLL